MRTVNKNGEIKVTATDVSEIETATRTTEQLLELLLLEAKKTNVYLSLLADEEVSDDDVGRIT